MKSTAVPIKPWVALQTAFRAVEALPSGHPRMILVHGQPGLGKTTAVDTLHLKFGGIYAVASSTWSQKSVLEKLADRLGIMPGRRDRTPDILDKVLEELDKGQHKMIVIDEFDRITHKRGVVELMREIYDLSNVPLVMVGMGSIDSELADIPQFPQRIGQRVEFKSLDLEDARKVSAALTDTKITDDLVEASWRKASGIVRLLVTEIAAIEQTARQLGLESIGVQDMEASHEA